MCATQQQQPSTTTSKTPSMTKTKTTITHAQKHPSPWMILAILQVLVWWLVLPICCKSIWNDLFGPLVENYNDTLHGAIPEMIMNVSSGYGMFVLFTLGMWPIYYLQIPFIEQYKISDKPWPWVVVDDNNKQRYQEFKRLVQRSLLIATFNLLILVPLLTWSKYYNKLAPAASFSVDDWPSYTTMLRDNIFLSIVHEFGFYSTHRLSHYYPWLYRFHKVHHEYKQNVVVAAQHNHPVDYTLSIAGPALMATIVVRPHSFTQFQWSLWLLLANLDDHMGYSFPWSPVRWFPFAATTDMHEFHHAINLGCFGSKLDIYDQLFSSNGKYNQWMITRQQKEQKKES